LTLILTLILQQQEAHKGRGCMINTAGSSNTHLDPETSFSGCIKGFFHGNKCQEGLYLQACI